MRLEFRKFFFQFYFLEIFIALYIVQKNTHIF